MIGGFHAPAVGATVEADPVEVWAPYPAGENGGQGLPRGHRDLVDPDQGESGCGTVRNAFGNGDLSGPGTGAAAPTQPYLVRRRRFAGEVAVWVPVDAGVVGGGAAVSPAGVVTGGTPEHDEVVGDQVLVQRQQMGEAGEPGRSLYFVCCHPEAGIGVESAADANELLLLSVTPLKTARTAGMITATATSAAMTTTAPYSSSW